MVTGGRGRPVQVLAVAVGVALATPACALVDGDQGPFAGVPTHNVYVGGSAEDYTRQIAESGFGAFNVDYTLQFCTELASMEDAGIDVGTLDEAAKQRVLARVDYEMFGRGWLNVNVGPYGHFRNAVMANEMVCPWLAAEFDGVPPTNRMELEEFDFPGPREPWPDQTSVKAAARRACDLLAADPRVTFPEAIEHERDGLPSKHVFSYLDQLCHETLLKSVEEPQ